jgi:hypothetical protein
VDMERTPLLWTLERRPQSIGQQPCSRMHPPRFR